MKGASELIDLRIIIAGVYWGLLSKNGELSRVEAIAWQLVRYTADKWLARTNASPDKWAGMTYYLKNKDVPRAHRAAVYRISRAIERDGLIRFLLK